MQLVLERCTVRPWRLDDAESLVRHANNRKVWLALRDLFPHPYTIEDARKFLGAEVNSEPITNFCIEVDGAAVGGIGVRMGQDVHRRTAELGYWLGQKFWGRGIMTDSINFRSTESTPNRLRTILRRRACWKKPVSFWKAVLRTTS